MTKAFGFDLTVNSQNMAFLGPTKSSTVVASNL